MSEPNAKDLFKLGAEPVDITAARLLWKSSSWDKPPLESREPISRKAKSHLAFRLRRWRKDHKAEWTLRKGKIIEVISELLD